MHIHTCIHTYANMLSYRHSHTHTYVKRKRERRIFRKRKQLTVMIIYVKLVQEFRYIKPNS